MKSVVKKKRKQKTAFSLVEMLVVIGIIAILVGLAVPAINAMQKSFNSTGAEGMISAALSTARTLAISNQQYAGVRFQKVYSQNNSLEADQYMIFIIYDSANERGWVCGFTAVAGYKPMKLPENVSVIDKIILNRSLNADCDCTLSCVEKPLEDTDLDNTVINKSITDTSTFSIVFSPAGKLVSHKLRCARKSVNDDVFNDLPTGMFVEDNYEDSGIGVEMSRMNFVIYDRGKFKNLKTSNERWDYLSELKTIYVNAYTGEIIKN